MIRKIRLGELNPDRKQTGGESDTHDFQGNDVDVSAPRARIEDVGTVWTENDTAGCSKDNFIDIQLCRARNGVSKRSTGIDGQGAHLLFDKK